MSMSTLVEGQPYPESNRRINFAHPHFYSREDYHWADQLYQIGDITAVVAVYDNIPKYLQDELSQLVADTYRRKLITVSFLEASLLLLKSGILPKFSSVGERSELFFPAERLDFEQQKFIEFVTCRKPYDIVVMVLRSDRLISTMTLYPLDRKNDIPSLSYLDIGVAIDKLPAVPALEVGRLAKTTCNGYHIEDPENSFIDMASMAAAFIVSDMFVSKNAMLDDPDAFICGDTHGALIACLKRFFPITTFDSRINPDMLKNDSRVRGMSIHFIQRLVLGSFESSNDILAAIQKIAETDPDLAQRIERLLESGLDRLGISSIHQFDPKRFRVQFFCFPYHHPETLKGLVRLEQMMYWLTSRPGRSKRILN